jgi:hypothetical protein
VVIERNEDILRATGRSFSVIDDLMRDSGFTSQQDLGKDVAYWHGAV